MYRLAIEVKAFDQTCDTVNSSDSTSEIQISLSDVVSLIESYPDDVQKFLKDIFHTAKEKEHLPIIREMDSNLDTVLESGLLTFEPVAAEMLLNELRKKDIEAILDRLNIHPERKLKKSDLIPWYIANIPALDDELPKKFYVSCTPKFKESIRKTYTYLSRKFDWDYHYNDHMQKVYYPRGARFENETVVFSAAGQTETIGNANVCSFPDDEITKILTLYGHNRCLNGYDTTPQLQNADSSK